MATRDILKLGDETLRKICRPVENFDERLHELLDDMKETLYEKNGVGLAAPQVGILRRVVVIDVGEGLVELVNPKIVEMNGLLQGAEGCLSVPDRYGVVERAMNITIKAQDRDGKEFDLSGSEMLAVAIQHEIDHLDGILFVDRAIEMLQPDEITRSQA